MLLIKVVGLFKPWPKMVLLFHLDRLGPEKVEKTVEIGQTLGGPPGTLGGAMIEVGPIPITYGEYLSEYVRHLGQGLSPRLWEVPEVGAQKWANFGKFWPTLRGHNSASFGPS